MPMEKFEFEIDTDPSDNVDVPAGKFAVFEEDDDAEDDKLIAKKAKSKAKPVEDEEDEDEIEVVADDPVATAKAEDPGDEVDPEGISEEEMASYSQKVRDRIGTMTRKRRQAERAAQLLQQENTQALEIVQRQQAQLKKMAALVKTGETQYVDAARVALDANLTAAKAKLKEALESGEPDKIADAQVEIAQAATAAQQAKAYRPVAPAIEAEVAGLDEESARPAARQAATQEPDPAAKAWLGRNRWFEEPKDPTDRRMRNYAIEFANELEAQGYDPIADATEYYSEINKELRSRFPDKFPAKAKQQNQNQKSGLTPSAGTGSAGQSTTPGKTKIRLTESQLRLASKLGISPKEYAVEYLRMYGNS